MDPRTPSVSEEEVIRDKNRSDGQSEKRSTTVTPTRRAEEVTVQSQSPTAETIRRTRTVGASAAYAQEYGRKKSLYYVYQIIWYFLGFIEIALAFRFVLKMLGANPNSPFARFVYDVSYPFAGPFLSLFGSSTARGAETTAVVEWSTLIAAAVWALIAWGIVKLLQLGKPVEPEEVERTVEEQ